MLLVYFVSTAFKSKLLDRGQFLMALAGLLPGFQTQSTEYRNKKKQLFEYSVYLATVVYKNINLNSFLSISIFC